MKYDFEFRNIEKTDFEHYLLLAEGPGVARGKKNVGNREHIYECLVLLYRLNIKQKVEVCKGLKTKMPTAEHQREPYLIFFSKPFFPLFYQKPFEKSDILLRVW